ncbi:MAG: response regulator [Thaumarchaeota archaeon]|nr:response regulator [Nitrososphaerota archaeon]
MARVMIAEDSEQTRMFLKDLLEIVNHEVVAEAADGLEAIEKFKTTKPDIVLLDFAMPKMDGLSTIREIKKMDENAKIILLTASGNLRSINECIQAGAILYILKPFKIEDLSNAIEETLSK